MYCCILFRDNLKGLLDFIVWYIVHVTEDFMHTYTLSDLNVLYKTKKIFIKEIIWIIYKFHFMVISNEINK